MACGHSSLLSVGAIVGVALAGGLSGSAAPGDWAACAAGDCVEDVALLQRSLPAERTRLHAHQEDNHTCLARVLALATPGKVGQFQLSVLNYDNAWHVTCQASQESLVLDPLFLGDPCVFGPAFQYELESAGWPGIDVGSIKTNAVIVSIATPDHGNLASISALFNRTQKVPVFAPLDQSAEGGRQPPLIEVIGPDYYAGLAAVSTLYPNCNPSADGDLDFQAVGDFQVCYAGPQDSLVQFRTVLIASSCGVLLFAPHGVEGPFSQSLVRALSRLRVGKHVVAIIGTSTLYQSGVVTRSFATVQQVLHQIEPDAFYDTHRYEYFAYSDSRAIHLDRVAPEEICHAFPDTYRGSPSRTNSPVQVPVYGKP